MKKNRKAKAKGKQAKRKQAKALKVSGNLNLIPPPEAHQITRSFAFKLNAGNYQSADFFCSESGYAKPGEEEKVSEALYQFCRAEVLKSINRYKAESKVVDMAKIRDESRTEAEMDIPF